MLFRSLHQKLVRTMPVYSPGFLSERNDVAQEEGADSENVIIRQFEPWDHILIIFLFSLMCYCDKKKYLYTAFQISRNNYRSRQLAY